ADEAIGHFDVVRATVHNTRFHLLGDLGILNALLTESALLHYATHTHRNFGIGTHTDKLRGSAHLLLVGAERAFIEVPDLALIPIEEVKAADLIRTVVRAI